MLCELLVAQYIHKVYMGRTPNLNVLCGEGNGNIRDQYAVTVDSGVQLYAT